MADINMNRPSKTAAESSVSNASSQPSSSVVQNENMKTSTAVFEDLWGQLNLDESPPTSRVSSPAPHRNHVHNHGPHNNNNHGQSQGQKRKKKIKIRMPRGANPLSSSTNINDMIPVIDTVIRETMRRESHSSSGTSRLRRHHTNAQSHRQNVRNSTTSHTQIAQTETKISDIQKPTTNIPSTASSSSAVDELLTSGNSSVAGQSRPLMTSTSSIPQQIISTQLEKGTSSSCSGLTTDLQRSPCSSPAKQQLPKDSVPPVLITSSQPTSSTMEVQPPSNPSLQTVPHSSTSPKTSPQPHPSTTRHTPLQVPPSSEPTIALPPEYQYMSDPQKQLYLEYQRQQMRVQQSQRSTPNVQQQHYPPHSQGIPPPQGEPQHIHVQSGTGNQQQQGTLIKPLSSNIPVQPASCQSVISQQQALVKPLPSVSCIPVQPISCQSGSQQQQVESSPSEPQQAQIRPLPSVSHIPVQPASAVQSNPITLQRQQQQQQQLLQVTSQQSKIQRVEQQQPLQMSQSPGHSSQATANVTEKRKPEARDDDENVTAKKQKTEEQPKVETKEASEASGPTAYHVGGENNLVVHAPTGCTFNIYQNKSQQQETSSGGGYCRNGCSNGNDRGSGSDYRGSSRTKQHAIEWAGATTETDSASQGHRDSAGSQIPIPVFREMSKSIARKWKFLARQLPMVEYGLLESELKVLDDCNGDDMDKALAVLTKWWRENPDRWDVEKMKRQLEFALKECQLVRLARNINETFRVLSI